MRAPNDRETMVDFRKDSAMADRIDNLTTRVETVETKLDQFSASVDRRFEAVDRRFEAVDRRFEAIDRRFEAIDRRFDQVDAALVEQRQYTEFAYARLEAKMDAGFGEVGRIARKLDQFIDVQLQTNQLVDRRLRTLEQQRSGPARAE
jgi:hypothetical protein